MMALQDSSSGVEIESCFGILKDFYFYINNGKQNGAPVLKNKYLYPATNDALHAVATLLAT